MDRYIVAIRFEDHSRNYLFACQADDKDHALEQAANAEPEFCELAIVYDDDDVTLILQGHTFP